MWGPRLGEATPKYIRGRPDDLAPIVDEWRELGRDYPTALAWRAGVAFLSTGLGQGDLIASEFEAVAIQGFATLPRDAIWLPTVVLLAEPCAWLCDAERASTLYARLRPYAGRVVAGDRGWACMGVTCYFLGRLAATMGQRIEAAAHFESALVFHRQMGARPLAARTQCEHARVLLDLGDAGDAPAAEDLARRAQTEAEALGMSELASQAGALCVRAAERT